MKKSEVMTTVAEIISFIKERAKVDISEAVVKGLVELDKSTAVKVGNIVESSIETSFYKAAGQLEGKLK